MTALLVVVGVVGVVYAGVWAGAKIRTRYDRARNAASWAWLAERDPDRKDYRWRLKALHEGRRPS